LYYQNLVTEVDSFLNNVECVEPPIEEDSGTFACDSIAKQRSIPACVYSLDDLWTCRLVGMVAGLPSEVIHGDIRNIKAREAV
jgi:hypothetical protein